MKEGGRGGRWREGGREDELEGGREGGREGGEETAWRDGLIPNVSFLLMRYIPRHMHTNQDR